MGNSNNKIGNSNNKVVNNTVDYNGYYFYNAQLFNTWIMTFVGTLDYYWIEDSVDHAESGRKIGLKSIIMDHPYNKEWDGPRVKNWKQIYEIINDTTY